MKVFFKFLIIVGCVLSPAIAFSSTSVWNSSANIVSSCAISPATLSFGVISVLSMVPQTDATATFPVVCTVGSPYSIQLGAGLNFANNTRNLAFGGGRVAYNLYTSSTYTTVWGDGANGQVVKGVGTGLDQNYTVYGRIVNQAFNANPDNSVGTYRDIVNITVDF